MTEQPHNKISWFSDSQINGIALPERFTFPFYYEPHPLAKMAADQLQHYLETQTSLDHNFGLDESRKGMVAGKMFGVLVVQDIDGRLGYLSAFSGNLGATSVHPDFVPPVFDTLTKNSFFLKGIVVIDAINTRVRELEMNGNYQELKRQSTESTAQFIQETTALKNQLKSNKEDRKKIRDKEKRNLNQAEYEHLEAELVRQSLYDKRQLKALVNKWEQALAAIHASLSPLESEIEKLKNERKDKSAALQQQLFEQYSFLNKAGIRKSLQEIFSQTPFGKPPAAAGECATPRLLQFAFANGYHPIAMAEFWWGASPKSEIRKHKQFYPACTGKCKPILAHMLEGMPIDDNPFLHTPEEIGQLDILHEDDSFVIVNKPAGLRSVPGVNIDDSVYSRLKKTLGTEPLMVHRLDMDTSGLLVVAKNKYAHRHIQRQFLQRTVSKRYRALLSKVIGKPEGEIDLPLCADLFNRPRQLVCFKTGKKSLTKWKIVEKYTSATRVDFWPLTGRTHQLRMHSAHELGLNAPIVGDDLYGMAAERMCLHAAYLEFIHPQTKEKVCFEVEENF